MKRAINWFRRLFGHTVATPCPTCGSRNEYLTSEQINAMFDDALKRIERRRPLGLRSFATKKQIDAAREEVLRMDFSE